MSKNAQKRRAAREAKKAANKLEKTEKQRWNRLAYEIVTSQKARY